MSVSVQHQSIIVYGTSLSAERSAFWRTVSGQWVDLLRGWLNARPDGEFEVLNASRWGATSAWGRAHLDRQVLRHRPDIVILEFAINDSDVGRNISLAQARGHLSAMVDRINECEPACRVVLLTTNPCLGHYAYRRPDLADYYCLYRDYAAKNALGLIDLEPVWQQCMKARPKKFGEYLPDGLHPSLVASRELLFPSIRQQLESIGL